MAVRLWKEAATLIIVGRSACYKGQVKLPTEADYNLLFLKRSQKSSFMPSAFVFPGGMADKSDFSLEWLDIFRKSGYTAEDLKQFRNEAPLPELYANKSKSQNSLLPEIGFRITAIRETFEECGLLLARKMPSESQDQIDIKKWSKAVHKDASQFLTFFNEFGGCPAIWDLHEWSNWLTPTDIEKRFDTVFYITFIDEIINVAVDRKEISELQIASPQRILEQAHLSQLWLPPPQIYEISRFLNYQIYDELKTFARLRGKKGLQRLCSVRMIAKDGVVSALPGDDLYPENSDHKEYHPPPIFASTMEELRISAKYLHRMELKNFSDIKFSISIKPKYDHLLPVNYKDLDENSKL